MPRLVEPARRVQGPAPRRWAGWRWGRRLGASACIALLAVGSACSARVPPELTQAPHSAVVTTAGPNQSMIHLARVETGILVFDLGWWGAEAGLAEGLAELGATEEDVAAVFITHAHRDHVGGWRAVKHAPFHMGEEETELFFGKVRPGGWIARWAARIRSRDLPEPGEVEVRTFSSDTAFVFGADTVRAFPVPGHTQGSSAYLFRETLFAGDAVAHSPLMGFHAARRGYSDDVEEARESLANLRARLEPYRVRYVCTAHAHCAPATEEFWEELLGG